MTRTRRHPIRGAIAGLLLGLGLTLLLVSYSIVPFGMATSIITVLAAMVLGVLIGSLGPARSRSA